MAVNEFAPCDALHGDISQAQREKVRHTHTLLWSISRGAVSAAMLARSPHPFWDIIFLAYHTLPLPTPFAQQGQSKNLIRYPPLLCSDVRSLLLVPRLPALRHLPMTPTVRAVPVTSLTTGLRANFAYNLLLW